MSKFTQRLSFNLSDTLARYTEQLTDFFKRALAPIIKTEAESQHISLARRESFHNLNDVVAKQLLRN